MILESVKCCFSLQSNFTRPPNVYRIGVNASHVDARKYNNAYVAMVSFPPNYHVIDEPSSPYSYVSCIKKSDNEPMYQCDSKDKLTFYVELTVSIIQPQNNSNSLPQNNTPSATVNIFGDQCNQQDICPDLAALAESASNDDKISLGPFGTWPKTSVIIFGCILARDDDSFNPNSLLQSEDDDNDAIQMSTNDTLSKLKSKNNDKYNINRSLSQRTHDSKTVMYNKHPYNNFTQDSSIVINVDGESNTDKDLQINEKDAYLSSNNEIYENSSQINSNIEQEAADVTHLNNMKSTDLSGYQSVKESFGQQNFQEERRIIKKSTSHTDFGIKFSDLEIDIINLPRTISASSAPNSKIAIDKI
ncbi:10795_t:CDS:2 [Scutellospora calospora]|uniref:10795_t:CDS:1 n=1 Tax=Scutellospora calospora TaxID=85575 RepID=A0ACA9LD05_9GLOM|nr:10795_t:CDS:2 [Scutellospora calospora]